MYLYININNIKNNILIDTTNGRDIFSIILYGALNYRSVFSHSILYYFSNPYSLFGI